MSKKKGEKKELTRTGREGLTGETALESAGGSVTHIYPSSSESVAVAVAREQLS